MHFYNKIGFVAIMENISLERECLRKTLHNKKKTYFGVTYLKSFFFITVGRCKKYFCVICHTLFRYVREFQELSD